MTSDPSKEPKIKGVFLKDHIDQLEKIAGKEIAENLKKRLIIALPINPILSKIISKS